MARKRAKELRVGDAVRLGLEVKPVTIQDVRYQSREWPMTVAVQAKGDWIVLPAEAHFEVA